MRKDLFSASLFTANHAPEHFFPESKSYPPLAVVELGGYAITALFWRTDVEYRAVKRIDATA